MGSKSVVSDFMDQARTMFVPPLTAGIDTLVVAIGKIAHKVFGTDHNKNMLYLVGYGRMTRLRVVAQYEVVLQAAKAAGWQMLVEKTSVFDDIEL
jgi:hypothetical protein